MRRFSLLMALALASCSQSREDSWEGELTYRHLVKIEKNLELPVGAGTLGDHQRFYSAKVSGDDVVVHGILFRVSPGSRGGVRIVTASEMPVVAGGGCSIVNLLYDLRRNQIREIFCNAPM
jgi:hypothetical protein